ncbi:hypothetical protein QFZ65_002108 [Arthrobacter sp. B3I9]|nr:hypothetical protein [Arthrobacter sp. B3I9]
MTGSVRGSGVDPRAGRALAPGLGPGPAAAGYSIWVFGRKKEAPTAQEIVDQQAAAASARDAASGKGAPTPKRSAQVAARKRPLVPEDRKASKAAERVAIQDQRLKMRQAMDTGDERFLPLRDKGPQKRFARNYVDARFNLGEYLMFGALVFVVVSLLVPASSDLMIYVLGAFWVMFLAVFVDAFILSRKLKTRLAAKFGEAERGTVWYGSMRSLQFRRLRMPKPQVKRGEFPS